MMRGWNDTYPSPFFVEHFSCLSTHLVHVTKQAMPFWNDDNPVALRQALAMIGGEFEMVCQRYNFDATLVASVALGITSQDELGYRELRRFMDRAEEVRVRRAEATKEANNARLVYERLYGDKSQAGIVKFPGKENDNG